MIDDGDRRRDEQFKPQNAPIAGASRRMPPFLTTSTQSTSDAMPRVPVLSVQMTHAAPRVSTLERVFMTARRAIRCRPR